MRGRMVAHRRVSLAQPSSQAGRRRFRPRTARILALSTPQVGRLVNFFRAILQG